MPFPENIKRKVLEACHYSCVWCHRTGYVEAHHIIPQEDSGPDSEDNACPLCPTCHAELGANPDLRKAFRQRRDWWIRHCSQQPASLVLPEITRILTELTQFRSDWQVQQRDFAELKTLLTGQSQRRIVEILTAKSFQQLGEASGVSLPPNLSVGAYTECFRCRHLAVPSDGTKCENCGYFNVEG